MRALFLIFRILLGILITGAGVGKLLDIPGFVSVIETYQLHIGNSYVWAIAIFVIIFEIALGLWILFGKNLKTGAILSMLMHAGYFILLSITLLRGIELQNCGCFGIFFARPLMWYSPLEDLVLIVISYGLFYLAKNLSRKIIYRHQ